MLSLTPVVEAPYERSEFWWPLPAATQGSPTWIELSGQASEMDVALVAYQCAAYNARARGGVLTPTELLARDGRLVLPGGLLVRSGGREIAPSCCCGLENWLEWRDVPQGLSPWMGHDPTPGIERFGTLWRLWPEYDMNLRAGCGEPIDFDLDTLTAELDRVAAALHAFVARLADIVEARVPTHGAAVAERFRTAFVEIPSEMP